MAFYNVGGKAKGKANGKDKGQGNCKKVMTKVKAKEKAKLKAEVNAKAKVEAKELAKAKASGFEAAPTSGIQSKVPQVHYALLYGWLHHVWPVSWLGWLPVSWVGRLQTINLYFGIFYRKAFHLDHSVDTARFSYR
jgi:hypothetical protein